jgi:putative flavoprotein involved in K+ transport
MTPTERARRWLASFGRVLAARDIPGVVAHFDDKECFWRDLVAFTWNIKTLECRAEIAAMLEARLAEVAPRAFAIEGEAGEQDGTTEARYRFETAVARGEGIVRLKGERCWTLLTAITELKGHEEPSGTRRDNGVAHGVHRGRKSWAEQRTADAAELGYARQPYCVIVGGGQGGMALGARLKRLGVPTIILERNARPGDSWRRRYKSLCLHDPVWYDHMPYIPFPDHWPVFSPKDKLGDWLEMYAKVMELDYWTSAPCRRARFDEARKEWVVTVDRAGEAVTLRPKQLVLATGMSGLPEVPRFPGAESFEGEQHHSSEHASGEPYAGRKCVVIGANNSAHDIAADLWEHGADVTMVQRSPTVVARSESLMKHAWSPLYSEEAQAKGITTELADLTLASWPHRVTPRRQAAIYERIRYEDKDFYARLEEAGFMLTFGEDGGGIHTAYIRRGSGYYIDVGASELVASGAIKLASRVGVKQIGPRTVVLSDGSEISAELIVYATGFGSMNGWAAELIGQDVADRVGKVWGIGSATAKDPGPWEGELRNMWKPTRQEGLWFHGGNLFQSRYYSLTLALQIKARAIGLSTPVYGMPEVHHLC